MHHAADALADLTARTTDLRALIKDQAAEADRLGRPSPAVWSALEESGYFYQFVPARFGGACNDFDGFMDATLPIVEACSSTGWVAGCCAVHNLILSSFPVLAHDDFWARDARCIISPIIGMPSGRATRRDGGIAIDGRWNWAGLSEADWLIVPCSLDRLDGGESQFFVAVPAKHPEVAIKHLVHQASSTHLCSISMSGVFVPDHRVVPAATLFRGDGADSVHKCPLQAARLLTAAIVCLGSTLGHFRACCAGFDSIEADVHVRKGVRREVDFVALARSDLLLRSSELVIRNAGRKCFAGSFSDDVVQGRRITSWPAEITHAIDLCHDSLTYLDVSTRQHEGRPKGGFAEVGGVIDAMRRQVVQESPDAYLAHGRRTVSGRGRVAST